MSIVTITLIMEIVIVLALVVTWLPWRKFAEKWIADNPSKATVYVKYGGHVDAMKGKFVYSNNKGYIYHYKWGGDDQHIVVPHKLMANHKEHYLHGRLMILVPYPGAGVAVEWLESEKSSGVSLSAYDLDALIRGQVAPKLVWSVYSRKTSGLLIILIIVIALVAGYFIYNNYNKPVVPVTPANQKPAQIQQPFNPDNTPYAK